jgi:hypothetical protein
MRCRRWRSSRTSLLPATSGPISFPLYPWRRCRSTAEAELTTSVQEQFDSTIPRVVQYTDRRSLRTGTSIRRPLTRCGGYRPTIKDPIRPGDQSKDPKPPNGLPCRRQTHRRRPRTPQEAAHRRRSSQASSAASPKGRPRRLLPTTSITELPRSEAARPWRNRRHHAGAPRPDMDLPIHPTGDPRRDL